MSSFEADVMEDLLYDEAEGPARGHQFDEFSEYDEFGEEESDEFLRNIIGGIGRAVGGLAGGADQYDEAEEWGEYDAYEEAEDADVMDAMEEAVADALGAEDTDEFFRRLARGVSRVARGAVRVARRVAPVVGRIARTVAPIASAIPLPWTQAIGRVANVVGRLMADEADEFEAFDEMLDSFDEGEIDAAAPVIAGLTIRRTMPGVARLPRTQRRQLVRSVTQATRTVARRQGVPAARAVPAVVRAVQRGVRTRRVPPRAVPRAITRAAAQVARSPQTVRRLAQATPRTVGRATRPIGPGRRFTLRGPVTISIQGR
ncbi:serine/threonine-protein kinase [Methylotetracoccus oryzae]|uniref:hypothetical protein n=1 Tax=Methylotetracoccus oryzae TaxID=1919059 RepID=UPI001119C9C5|nr:hypothetical protein [Methylotetracoccus oryzae]